MLFVGKSTRCASSLLYGILYEKFKVLFVTGNCCEPQPVTCANHVVVISEIKHVLQLGVSTIRPDYSEICYSILGFGGGLEFFY